MRRHRRRELFPPDRRLQARMLVAGVATPLVVLAAAVAVIVSFPLRVVGVFALAATVGIVAAVRARRRVEHARLCTPEEEPELHALVERLCVIGDLPRPEIAIDAERQPNSWMIDVPGRPPRLHVTEGLLELLGPAELEAVLAHELSHVANRDATVMTVVGGPGAALLEGGAAVMRGGYFLWPGAALAGAIGLLSRAGTSSLSRARELSADAGAAALTGRPSALASALMKVSGDLARIPASDLRAVAGRDAFHLLPVEGPPAEAWWGQLARLEPFRRLGATHPSLERRLAELERLERRMHAARPSPRV